MKKVLGIAITLLLCFVSLVGAATTPTNFEKLLFKRHLKEYSCKLVYPSLRHEKPDLAKYDMNNLKAKIILDLTQNTTNYQYLSEFINENPDLAPSVDCFAKMAREKQKFEVLQNNKFDFRAADEINERAVSSGEMPFVGLGEWILFKYSFNLPPDKYDLISKISKNGNQIGKAINDEYALIAYDYRSITDKDTLLKLGPSVIGRSEALITGNDAGLNDSNIQDLYVMAGNCRVGLDLDLSTTPREVVAKYYVDYIKRVYARANIPRYKFYSLYAVTQMLESVQKYEELLDFYLVVKNDTLDKIDVLYNLRIVVLICKIIIEKCPVKEEYFKLGKENCDLLIIYSDKLDIITPDQREIVKQIYRFGYHTELYAKYQFFNEAVNQLDIVIASPPPPPTTDSNWISIYNDIHQQAITRREQLLPSAVYIKTDKEKIVCNVDDKTTTFTAEAVNGLGAPAPYKIKAILDNPEIAEINIFPSKSKGKSTYSVKIKNYGECNITLTVVTKKSDASNPIPPKVIPLHAYRAYVAEASFVENGEYIKLKEPVKNGNSYVDQDITSPEYKYDGINLPIIKCVALERKSNPKFTAKIKILAKNTISKINVKVWVINADDTISSPTEYTALTPNEDDKRFFTVSFMLKYFSNNSSIRIGYEIYSITYKSDTGDIVDDRCQFDGNSGPIPLYYAWKKTLSEPAYKEIAQLASGWVIGLGDLTSEKNIVDELYKGWTYKKLPQNIFYYSPVKLKAIKNEEEYVRDMIINNFGECAECAYVFKYWFFHDLVAKIPSFY